MRISNHVRVQAKTFFSNRTKMIDESGEPVDEKTRLAVKMIYQRILTSD